MSIRIQKVLSIVLIILSIVDTTFISKYLIIHGEQIRLSTMIRLITFIICHCYFIIMLVVQYRLQQRQLLQHVMIYKYSEWLMYTFVPIVVLQTLVQIVMFIVIGPQHRHVLLVQTFTSTTNIKSLIQQQQQQQRETLSAQRQQQLHIINFYFLIYMYAMILAILATLYMIANKMLQRFERRRYDELVNGIVENYVETLDRKDDLLRDKQCSICQFGWNGQGFNQYHNQEIYNDIHIHQNSISNKVEVVHLECSHIFHKQCILQWVKKTYQQSLPTRCPNCRQFITI